MFDWYKRLTDPRSDIENFIVYDVDVGNLVNGTYIPEFQEDHECTFVINMNMSNPKRLNFSVSDGIFSDNSGEYVIKLTPKMGN